MGYAPTLLYGDNFQIGGTVQNVAVTSVIGSKALGTITLPSDMIVKKAYLDLSIRGVSSSSGGAFNWLVANAILQATRGGSSVNSLTLTSESLYCFGSAMSGGAYFYGQVDVGAVFAGGEATTIALINADSLGDNLFLWDVQPIVRIIMR